MSVRSPIIAGVGIGTSWALHTLVHASSVEIFAVLALTCVILITVRGRK